MSTPLVAGAAALGFYVWVRQSWLQCSYVGVAELPELPETHARTEQPPTTWSETLYLFKEALRYLYTETFGRWHAIDLFFGLAYLSRRPCDDYPAADIAAAGVPLHGPVLGPAPRARSADADADAAAAAAAAAVERPHPAALLEELRLLRRYMLYCQGLRHHRPELQRKHWHDLTGLEERDVLAHCPTAGLLRPAYAILADRAARCIILVVRGTHSRPDMFTSLTGTVKPHHQVTQGGVVLGYSHLGMLAAARWLLGRTRAALTHALAEHPGYQLRVVGHSMGGGTAAMLVMMMRDKVPELSGATAWAIACPACMTLELAASCAPFVTTLVHGTDIVPTFSPGAIDRLRDEVTHSSWFADFQSDVRQRLATNFGASVAALRCAAVGGGEWTQRNLISTAATSFKSCYNRAPRSCRIRDKQSSTDDPASPPPAASSPSLQQHRSVFGFHLPSARHGAGRQQQQQPADASSSGGGGWQQSDGGASGAGPAADSEAASLLQLQRGPPHSPLQWLRLGSGRGRRPGIATAAAAAAAAGSGPGRPSDGEPGQPPPPSEAVLVERALEACLLAADEGQLSPRAANPGPGAGAAAAAASSGGGASARAPAPGSRGAALAGSIAKAASKVVLRTKRPAAPSKKDDDAEPSAAQVPAAAAAASGGVPPLLPVSTSAAGSAARLAAAGAGADGSALASKPRPGGLRSRRGWGGWVAGQGWASPEQSAESVSTSMLAYLGHTVVETTGQLLKSSGGLFVACAAPRPAAAGVASPGVSGAAQPRQPPGAAGDQQQPAGGGGCIVTAPSGGSKAMMMVRDEAAAWAPGSAAGGRGGGGGGEDGSSGEPEEEDSDSDPDLQDDAALLLGPSPSELGRVASYGGAAPAAAPDGAPAQGYRSSQPAMRASISALMAAVSRDEDAAAMHEAEARAAEWLLHEAVGGASEANIARLAAAQQQQQQQQQPQQAAATAADGGGARAGAGAGSAGSRARPGDGAALLPPPRPQAERGAASADGASSHASAGSCDGAAAAAAPTSLSADGSPASRVQDSKAAERHARRQMFPAGRILHLMPASVVAAAQRRRQQEQEQESEHGEAGGEADELPPLPQLPPLTAALGSVGLGDEYVLLQVPSAAVYGRMRLCPAMVRDHFIPSMLRATDSVMQQLERELADLGAVEEP